MLKETNLDGVKSIAKQLVMVRLHLTEFSPVVVQHPFTSSGMVATPSDEGIRLMDITKNDADFTRWQDFVKAQIDHAENAYHIYMMTNKAYALTFLKMATPFLSQKDFSKILSAAWIRSENPNLDPNVTTTKLLSMFKKAAPEHLMSEKEQALLQSLPEQVTVYRGLTSYNAKKIEGLSWTLNQHTAEWFAQRYNEQGKVYQATVNKADIIAILTDRNESEVIIDPKTLKDISVFIDFGDENTIKERRYNEMKLKEFETERDEILKDIDWSEFHTSPDFQCDQTDGVPTCLCAVFSKGKAWLEPTSSVTEDLSPEELEKFHTQCAAFGIRECNDPAEFNELLEKLGEDAVQTASIPEEDFELYEDTGMGGIQ